MQLIGTDLLPRSAALWRGRGDEPISLWAGSPTESWARVLAPEYQRAEFIDELILAGRIVVREILPQFVKEFTLALLLAFQPEAHERGNGLTHAGINGLGVLFDLFRRRCRQTDAVPQVSANDARLRFTAVSWRTF